MLRLVEIRYDKDGKSFLALQGQSNAEAKEMNREFKEKMEKVAAEVLNKKFNTRS